MIDLTKRLPDVSNIRPHVPWSWFPVQVAFDVLPSADAGWIVGLEGAPVSDYAELKRCDPGYDDLVESLAGEGFFDPVYVGDGVHDAWESYHGSKHGLGNGHHRVVAAYDLGFTHIPVTSDARYRWASSGPVETEQ